jgi:hypothetical protein
MGKEKRLNQSTADGHSSLVTLSETKGLSERFFAPLRMTGPRSSNVKCTNVLWPDLSVDNRFYVGARRRRAPTLLVLFLLSLVSCTSSPPETSKSLVKISNVTLSRLDERTLRVTLNYDLEAGVKLPLPYKSVLVFPLEPRGKLLAAQVPEMEFSTGLIALDLEVPKDAGFDWKDLEAKDACCVVSLKGEKGVLGSNVPEYERISNSVTVALPQFAG